jgi:ABC-2 type transport system permease protein
MSKVYAALTITTIPLMLGVIILIIRFKLSLIEMLLLLSFSIIIPLVSHFIGLIMNLKYPKLDYENSAEVVKQSTSSFLSVMIGMLLLIVSVAAITKLIEFINPILVLIIFFGVYVVIDIILYLYLVKVSTKNFDNLSI